MYFFVRLPLLRGIIRYILNGLLFTSRNLTVGYCYFVMSERGSQWSSLLQKGQEHLQKQISQEEISPISSQIGHFIQLLHC